MKKANREIILDELLEYKLILFGASKAGENIYNVLQSIDQRINIEFFCDNDKNKHNKYLNNIKIIDIEQLKNIGNEKVLIVICSMYYKEIQQQLLQLDCKSEFIIDKELISSITRKLVEERNEKYEINYEKMCNKWLSNICSEVYYWKRILKKEKEYVGKLSNPREFELERIKKYGYNEKSIILDVGSGPLPKYGNTIRGKNITYLPVDPLAYYYKQLYKENDIYLPVLTEFGIMENLSLFFKNNYADFIIINNALDHSIDPIKAIIECFKVLKVGGYLTLGHVENEAVFQNNSGLHKWNIFLSKNNDFIIYNEKNKINVTKLLNNYVQIEATREKETEYEVNRYWITINIRKVCEIDNKIIEKFDSKYDLGVLIKQLFLKLLECRL